MSIFIFSEIVLFRPPRLHNKFEPNHVKFTGLATLFYIGKFIKEQIHGMVGHMTGDNQDQFQTPLCVVYYKVDYKLNPKGKGPKMRLLVPICSS